MERDPKRFALSRFMMSPEELEAYNEPSIMDDYIKKNDPEQYDKITRAKNINQVIGMGQGMGGPMGVIGSIRPKINPNLSVKDKIEALRKIYQGSVPVEQKSITQVFNPAKAPVTEAAKTLSKSDRDAILTELRRMKDEGDFITEKGEKLFEQAFGPRKPID